MHRTVLGHNFACYKDGFKCICVSGQPYVPKPEFVNMSNYPGHRPECFIYDGKCYCESSSPWLIRPTTHDGKELSLQEVIQLYRSDPLPLTINHLGKPSDEINPYQSKKIDQETSLKRETLQKSRLISARPFVEHTQPRRELSLYPQLEVSSVQRETEPGKQEIAELLEQKSQLSTVQSAAHPAASSTEQSEIHKPKECSVQSEVQRTNLITEQLEPHSYQTDTEQLSREQSRRCTQAVMQQSFLDIGRPTTDRKKHPEKLLRHVPLCVLQRALEYDIRSKWEQHKLQYGHVISMPYQANLKYNCDHEEQVIAKITKDERETDENVSSKRLPKLSYPKNASDKIHTTHEFGQVPTPRNEHTHCNLEFPNWTLLYPYVLHYPESFMKNPQQIFDLSEWHTANVLSHFPPQLNHELVERAISWGQNSFLHQNGTYQPYAQNVQIPWQHSY